MGKLQSYLINKAFGLHSSQKIVQIAHNNFLEPMLTYLNVYT